MASLVGDLLSLNSSLDRVDRLRQETASFKSNLDSLSSRMDSLSRTVGDTVHDNTDLQDSVQGFGDRILKFEVGMDYDVNRDSNSFIRKTGRVMVYFKVPV